MSSPHELHADAVTARAARAPHRRRDSQRFPGLDPGFSGSAPHPPQVVDFDERRYQIYGVALWFRPGEETTMVWF